MTVQDFITGVRYPLNDFRDAANPEYSDTELISYINRGLQLLSLALTNLYWRGQQKEVSLVVQDKSTSIPEDFIKEVFVKISGQPELTWCDDGSEVKDGYYSIVGRSLYVNLEDNEQILLRYFYAYSTISVDDNLPIPDWMVPYLHNIVVFLALNRNEFALNVESRLVKDAAMQIAGVSGGYGVGGKDEDIGMAW